MGVLYGRTYVFAPVFALLPAKYSKACDFVSRNQIYSDEDTIYVLMPSLWRSVSVQDSNNRGNVTEGILKTSISRKGEKMKLRTIAIILLTLTLAFGSSTAFAKSKHHHHKVTAKSHHAAKLHHKSKSAAPVVATPAPVEPAAETPQQAQ